MNEFEAAASRAAMEIVQKAFASTGLFGTVAPKYKFWKSESGDRYFYTTEKINQKGKPRYVAGVYRYLKTRKVYKLVKKSGFAKKYKAKERAYKWYEDRV